MKKNIFMSLALITCMTSINARDRYYSDSEEYYYENQSWCNGIGFFGEFLYWKTNIATFPYAITTVAGVRGLTTDQKLIEVPYGSDPGFRVGAHYAFAHDWDASLLYTRFKQSASSSIATTDTLDLKTVWDITALVQADSAQAMSMESFQTIDLVFGKTFLSCPFTILYYAGFKWARLREFMQLVYNGRIEAGEGFTGDVTVPIELDNSSKNLGIIGGARAVWDFAKGFGFYSRGELGLLSSKFDVSQSEVIEGSALIPPVIPLANNQLFRSVKTNLVLELGVQWATCLFNDAVQVAFNVGYELNYWPTQLLLARFIPQGDPLATTGPLFITNQSSDVGFRGFNFGACIEF